VTRDVLRPGLLAGVGLAMTLDEVVFHQLLGWHHLVEESPLSSDGVLHVAGTVALLVGTVQLVLRTPWSRRRVTGAVLAGAGGFNVFDGIVDHKVLRLHQVREGVANTLPYDITWLVASALVLLAGVLLLRGTAGASVRAGRVARGNP
jgi:uncharacterized membrane protein